MGEEASTTTAIKKESAVLTDSSLAILARDVGAEKYNGLVFLMLLNVPTTTIVHAANGASACGLIGASDATKIEVTLKLLMQWKRMKALSKEKDKVKDLERAFREMGQTERADMIVENHTRQTELTPDAFANLQ